MQSYTISTPLKHNGKRRQAGKTIKLSNEEAAPLLAVGAISESTPEEGSTNDPATGTEKPTGEGEQGAASEGNDPASGSAGAGESSGDTNTSERDDPSGAEPSGGEPNQSDGTAGAGSAASESGTGSRVNVNSASVSAIALAAKGIGKKTAADIVAHRDEKGSFAKLDDLTAVGGISQAIVDDNRDVLTV